MPRGKRPKRPRDRGKSQPAASIGSAQRGLKRHPNHRVRRGGLFFEIIAEMALATGLEPATADVTGRRTMRLRRGRAESRFPAGPQNAGFSKGLEFGGRASAALPVDVVLTSARPTGRCSAAGYLATARRPSQGGRQMSSHPFTRKDRSTIDGAHPIFSPCPRRSIPLDGRISQTIGHVDMSAALRGAGAKRLGTPALAIDPMAAPDSTSSS